MSARAGWKILALSMAFLSGCSVLMPYKTDFQCKVKDKGKCATVNAAYDESKKSPSSRENGLKDKDGSKSDEVKKTDEALSVDELYRANLQRELSALLESPVTPVVTPPKVIRALVFPYPDRKFLYMPRYVYLMTDEPEWVIGNYLMKGKGSR